MTIKKFVGKTESDARAAAERELGEGVFVMNVRKVKAKGPFAFLKKKQVEVTAAVEDEEEPLRQLRRIAQAQVEAQERIAGQGGAGIGEQQAARDQGSTAAREAGNAQAGQGAALAGKPDPLQAIAAAGARTGIGPAASGRAAARQGFSAVAGGAGEAGSRSIEQRLDNLQSLLENQFQQGNVVLGNVRGGAASGGGTERPAAEGDAEDPRSEADREMDRFLRLLYNTMIENEVDERYANEIIREAERNRKPNATMDFLLSAIYQKMILKFGRAEGISPAENGSKVIFFLGPTGVGKTTTIAKVASSFSVSEKKKVALLTTDTYRIAASDQLRTYASILGAPFRVIYTEEEIQAAVEDFADCEYIFVDTAGHSHKNEELLEKQKRFLDALPEGTPRQGFLVLSATTKYKDLKKIVDNYREISDFQLIFTKLDETGSLGNLYNMRLYADAPIAFVTAGQNVPDDIEAFNAQKLVKQLLSEGGGK